MVPVPTTQEQSGPFPRHTRPRQKLEPCASMVRFQQTGQTRAKARGVLRKRTNRAPQGAAARVRFVWLLAGPAGAALRPPLRIFKVRPMPTTVCPSCEKTSTAPNCTAGQSVRCPACSLWFQAPSLPPPKVDAPENSSPHRLRQARRSRGLVAVAAAVVLAVVGIGGCGGAGSESKQKPEGESQTARPEKSGDGGPPKQTKDAPQKVPAKDATAERDRDYLTVLETLYELDGLANGKKFWLNVDDQAGFKDLRGPSASLVVSRAFDPALKSAEFGSVERRKMFVDWHKMDSKDWRPEFVKRYPERAVINDEIAVVVRDLCSQHLTNISSHLVDQKEKIGKELFKKADSDPELNARMARNGPKIIDDQWHEYRVKYLEKQGPKLVEEVRAAVKKMDSIVRLKAKVEKAAPPQK